MTIIDSIILGTVEGITEFLPISSTGHLIVASEFLGLEQTNVNKAFEVVIQFAAILAVILTYPSKFTFKHIELWIKIAIAFIPIAAIGFLLSKQIKAMFDIQIVAIMFIVGGIAFIIIEKFYNTKPVQTLEVDDVTYKQAAWIGFAQLFALIPGTSRAGASIIGAMLVGLSRKASTEFSFLLALPVLSATTAYDLLKHHDELFAAGNILNLTAGFIVSFIVAFLSIKVLIKFVQKFTFIAFGIYRIIFGTLLLIIF